jgi:hypothetical protein
MRFENPSRLKHKTLAVIIFMTHKFQINARHQIKSFEKGLITFLLAFVGVIICGAFGAFDLTDYMALWKLFMVTCILFSLPAVYLHFTYLLDNWGKVLIVDNVQNAITIKTRKKEFIYKYSDIETTELNIGIYYKNLSDNRVRWPAPWTNYGYLKVRLKDGKEFSFTSLMADLSKLPLPVTMTKFRLIPSLKR